MTLASALNGLLVLILLVSLLTTCGLAFFTWHTAGKVRAALPPQGRFIQIGAESLHVLEQGTGPSLLLIHGLGGQMRHYTYGVAERLARQYRVITIDRPGSGYSVRSAATPANLSTQAATIASLMDTLKLGPVFVVGHSLGGAIALCLAVEHPHRVTGLALLAPLTHLPADGKPAAAFRALTISTAWIRTLVAWTLAVPASIAGRRAVLDQVFGPDAVPRDFPTRGGGLLSLLPSQFISASRDLQAVQASMPPISARYGELSMPVRVLFGRDDRILDWKANGQTFVDKVTGAELVLVDGGHMLPVVQPELTAAFILETMAISARSENL
ncbi:MAG: alpha/beta hydrolase [Herminiimonas sp.]|nr:alpha/beta hydrolase [Herminiimonas sp.]